MLVIASLYLSQKGGRSHRRPRNACHGLGELDIFGVETLGIPQRAAQGINAKDEKDGFASIRIFIMCHDTNRLRLGRTLNHLKSHYAEPFEQVTIIAVISHFECFCVSDL